MNNQNNQFAVQYNPEAALKAGGGDFIQDGGAYIVDIVCAKYITAKTKSKGMEFEVKTTSGQSAKFIKIYYEKADGSQIPSGYSVLCGIMHFLKLNGLTVQNAGDSSIAPELTNKRIGLTLQKNLYTKSDLSGEGYSFEIKAPYNPTDMKTVREEQEQKPAAAINNWVNSYKDVDKRTTGQPVTQPSNSFDNQNSSFGNQDNQFDNQFNNSDIPFNG